MHYKMGNLNVRMQVSLCFHCCISQDQILMSLVHHADSLSALRGIYIGIVSA